MTSHLMQDNVVLVTGGARGVGRGISEAFLKAGATVVICGRHAPEQAIAVDGHEAIFIAADIRDSAAAQALVTQVIDDHGRIDVLVNNAGGAPFAHASTASPRFHEAIIRLNLLAPLNLAQSANAQMQQQSSGGVIINIGSISADRASPGTAAYGAAKAGLLNLTQSLAVEWAPKVRVCAVSPGPVLTEQAHLHFGDEAGVAAVAKTIPMQRLAQPGDIADACVWLASAQAAYISGSNLLIHGGGERPAFLDQATANRD